MNVLIIYGGKSCEHDISIITACLARGYFDGNLVSAYLDKNNRCYLVPNDWTPKKHVEGKLNKTVVFKLGEGAICVMRGRRVVKTIPIDVAVNCCHGVNGEDGCIAALCQMSGIPLVGSDLASSAVAMDKALTKRVLNSFDIPTVKGVELTKSDLPQLKERIAELRFPLIIKPCKLGSSIGVEVCKAYEGLEEALMRAFKLDAKVLVEEALSDFTELNCAAMRVGGKVKLSVIDQPLTTHDILTFADKYVENEAYDRKPAPLDEKVASAVEQLTTLVYEKLGFGGVIRVDYLLDKANGKLYVNEINTTPGSLAYGLWEAKFSRTAYGEALVEQAIADYRELQIFVYDFDSGVLSGGNGIKKK
ncbi:MAG: ATP-grasp domain-containing protein [Clostridiales bacterium]|nr:ATP-grasp domain-containing protein [Clostridiales bacterium]